MPVVLISGGTGLIGTNLTRHLSEKNYDVIILTRDKDKQSDNPKISYAFWDIQNHEMDEAAIKKAAVICVANVHMFAEAQQSPDFLQIINNADIVTPDGKPMAWALRILYGIKQDRVAGMDLLPDLLAQMEKAKIEESP